MKPNKPHPDFPLSPWPNGQWGKKIKGKQYYFGSWSLDPKGDDAIKEYDRRLPGILAGTDHLRTQSGTKEGRTVGELSILFLSEKRDNARNNLLSYATLGGYLRSCPRFVEWVKPTTPIVSLKPEHFSAYAAKLVSDGLHARARKNEIAYVKAMFRWGAGNGHSVQPQFGTGFKAPMTTAEAIRKEKQRAGLVDYSKRIVTGEEIDTLVAASQPNMAAMILLGVNCGLGPADLGRLRWRNIKGMMLDYPRHKTGADRRGYLWKRTRDALERVRTLKHTKAATEKDGDDALVFLTRHGEPYYREVEKIVDGKMVGVIVQSPISLIFGRAAANMPGLTFYRLRHTTKTLGKRAKDSDALDLIMGHKKPGVAEGYNHEEISDKRVKRVALAIKHKLWPDLKRKGKAQQPVLRYGDAKIAVA